MKDFFLKVIYRILAGYARKVVEVHNPKVVAITGSVGKTSAKEAIFQVLYDEYGGEVRKNYGNLNTEIGIPLTILGYQKIPNKFVWPLFLISAYFRTLAKTYPKILVLEMGIDHSGDMDYFGTIVRPDIGIITSTAPVHLVNFDSHEALIEEKKKMAKILKRDGKLIINADDSALTKMEGFSPITVGIKNKDAVYHANNVKLNLDGMAYRIETKGQRISIKSQVIGQHLIISQLVAFAVGQIFGIQSLKIEKSIKKIQPVPGRMNLVKGKNNCLIIDDTYNANPQSVKAALDSLSSINFSGRKVVILGNMNELGKYSEEAHLEIGKYAKDKCDLAVFVGQNAGLMKKGYGDDSALIFNSRTEIIKSLPKFIKPKDLILIKASQNGNFFEEIVKNLMADPQKAKEILVRQSNYWIRKK